MLYPQTSPNSGAGIAFPSEHRRSTPIFSGIRVTRSLVLCVCFLDRYLSICPFLGAIVLSVLLRFTDSDLQTLLTI
jgi:hypothetical protein